MEVKPPLLLPEITRRFQKGGMVMEQIDMNERI